MAEDRLIVWKTRTGRILGAFSTIEEASAASGVKQGIIYRCLNGVQSYTGKQDYTFFYEVKAGDLRRQKAKERREKWMKKNA